MSVEQVARSDGTKVWRVRWRDEHGRNRSKTLGRKRDAESFDAEIRRLRRLGELGIMDAGRISLAEFGQEWLIAYAVPNLEPKTMRTYESLWDRHVLPSIGGLELRQLRPAVLDRYLAQLQQDGLSPATVKRSLACFRASSSGQWSGNVSPRTRCAWHTSRGLAGGS